MKRELLITDGGQETTLSITTGWSCRISRPSRCSTTKTAGAALRRYYGLMWRSRRERRGLVLETPTWRSNPDWGARLGYDGAALDAVNAAAVAFVAAIRDAGEAAEPRC